MNILLIEDDDIKAQGIETYINQVENSYEIELKTVRRTSWRSGLLEIIKHNDYNFIFLDMSMPRYDSANSGGKQEFMTYAGWDILKEMKRKRIKILTYVITSFDVFGDGNSAMDAKKLNVILKEDFNDFYGGMIYYNALSVEWKERLKKVLIGENER